MVSVILAVRELDNERYNLDFYVQINSKVVNNFLKLKLDLCILALYFNKHDLFVINVSQVRNSPSKYLIFNKLPFQNLRFPHKQTQTFEVPQNFQTLVAENYVINKLNSSSHS